MKTVFTDISQVAHLWANQLQDEARNSGNFYFNGNTIYSYGSHFPIAKHVKNTIGESAILFTERSYSHTTSKHIAVVRQAVSYKDLIYCYSPNNSHLENFNQWLRQAENEASNLQKAKKPEKYLSALSFIKNKVEKYATFFSIEIPEKLQVALSIGNKNEFLEYAAKKESFELAEKKKAEIEHKKRHLKELKEWLKGNSHRLYTRNGHDYLRLNGDRIETTQAVQIPLGTGKKLWQAIKDNKLTVGSKVLDYTVDEVGKDIKIGCHNFKASYLIKFGEEIF